MVATCVRFAYLIKRFHAETENRIDDAIFAVMWMLIEVNTAILGKGCQIMSLQLNLAVFLTRMNDSGKLAIAGTRIALVA